MICPACQTANPDGAIVCLKCSGGLAIALAPPPADSSDSDHIQTIVPPSNFQEWAKGQALYSTPVSLVLPEGVEIGHRYKVARLLGVGGMGAVYRVHDRDLDRDVALKLIRGEIANSSETLERFKREIQLSSRVTHRNVLRVFDLGQTEGIKYLTMEYVEGEDLAGLLKREKSLPIPRILSIFRQICEGLQAAHEKGVIHRDLKPQNVMIGAEDHVYLMDFGLAKTAEQSGVTQTGAVIGTPNYMSPEQVKGLPAGPQSDIYSLGIILYEMLAGVVPFTGKSVFEVMVQRIQKPPRPIAELNPQTPGYLQKILGRCLAVDPTLRYQNAGEILADLDSGSFRPTLRYAIRRRQWLRPAVAGVAIAVLLAGAGWWLYRRGRTAKPAAPQAAQSVLIADFANRTGDAVFDGTLEPAFSIAMEGASFVTSYSRNQARKIAAQLQPGAAGLDETLARLVAVREGIDVVTSGAVERRGEGYEVSVRAVDAATGKSIVADQEKASGKEAVLSSVARLAAKVRGALGDTTPASAQLAAAETYSAGSLDAAHEYAVAQDLQWAGNWEEAIRHYRKALDLDPNLGRAWAGLAAVESNRGRRQEAEKNYKEALARIDRMSDREKYRTRGGYYLMTRNPDNAIEEFTALVKQYPADTAGIANLAFAYFVKRDMAKALEWGRRAVEIYPKNVPQRNNLGLIAMYASDFETGIREQQTVLQLNPQFVLAYVGLALSQLGAGRPAEALETWNRLSKIGPAGASAAAAGLADLALYEGRLTDARAILETAIEQDLAGGSSEEAARKLSTLAETRLREGQVGRAVAAAERALAMSKDMAVEVSAARVLAEAGEDRKALAVADELGQRLEPDPQMYALLLRGETELRRGNFRGAISRFQEAQKKGDAWLVRYDLARAYVGGGFYPEASTELDVCVKRRGEATALFLDDVPTDRVFAPVSYYIGRTREGLKSPAASEAYRTYLETQKGEGDALAADARRRLAAR